MDIRNQASTATKPYCSSSAGTVTIRSRRLNNLTKTYPTLLQPSRSWTLTPCTCGLVAEPSVLALVGATAGAFVLAMRHIGASLSAVVAAAQQVGSGDFSVRVEEQGLPWIRSLAAAFNTMTSGLERQAAGTPCPDGRHCS